MSAFPGYPPSAAAGALAMPPFGRVAINLRANRTIGETFPAIEGQFFYVESADLPCRVAFNGAGEDQSIGISSGLQCNMPFKGITLFHDDYTTTGTAPQQFTLQAYVGRDARAFNQFVNPQTQTPIPFLATFLGDSLTIQFPLFPRLRFLNVFSTVTVSNATDPGVMNTFINFRDPSNNLMGGTFNLVKNGVLYPSRGVAVQPAFIPSTELTAGVNYVYNVNKQNVPVPTGAEIGQLVCRLLAPPTNMATASYILTN